MHIFMYQIIFVNTIYIYISYHDNIPHENIAPDKIIIYYIVYMIHYIYYIRTLIYEMILLIYTIYRQCYI